ncbi:hypothetical protein BFP97_00860 [Roseivirga sp. 4D4]|uniref:hypothetical protein n=1 Tax=Roseivirga sp. 4D4 TaxID=1889784 RepID=UPI000852A966|nr:hypothetical protein [Roseivirga sp. 4D4]OEK00153.1 hypothetical protein BFP97_00860 [Roseivirga sp. 4D4]
MKHKILLATNADNGFDNLISDMLSLLNKTHKKYVSAFSPQNFHSKDLVTANAQDQGVNLALDGLVKDYEAEIILEKEAAKQNVEFEWISEKMDHERLSSFSVVFDLLILELEAFKECDTKVLDEMLSAIKCPVLLLPRNWEVENLVIFHDGSIDSVKMVKNFLNMFNPNLRDIPLSVLISQPSAKYDVEAEKIFIDYLKLFFKDLGVQLIQGEPMDNLDQAIVYNSHKPFLMLGVNGYQISGKQLMEAPTFLFKG